MVFGTSSIGAAGTTAQRIAHEQLDNILMHGDQVASRLIPTAGNRLSLLEGVPAFTERLLADISAACHQINVTEFAIKAGAPDGPLSGPVLQALRDKARSGVPVTVQLDQVGSGLLNPLADKSMLTSLRAAGVDVKVKPFTLGRGGVNDARLAADHRKIFEIDGRVAYHGGVNLVDNWSSWHDLMVRVEGPAAAQSGALLAGRWRDLGGTITDTRRAILHQGLATPASDATAGVQLLTNGNRLRRELTDEFINSVTHAQDRVWVTNPYLGDERVMQSIVDAAKRGVDVRLVLSPKATTGGQYQDIFTDPMRRAWAHEIVAAGGTVHNAPEFTHAKAFLIDDRAIVGSFNLDRSSTVRNYENALASEDPGFVRDLEQMFLRQQTAGMHVTQDAAAGWSTLARIRDALGLQY